MLSFSAVFQAKTPCFNILLVMERLSVLFLMQMISSLLCCVLVMSSGPLRTFLIIVLIVLAAVQMFFFGSNEFVLTSLAYELLAMNRDFRSE